jgi:CBS domain containing-hemolysin-like protein
MKRLFEMYENEKLLDPQERRILTAALELHERKTFEVMKPLDGAYMLDIDLVVDKELLRTIYTKGYSRIPVYEGSRERIVGILLTRDLILINPEKNKRITIRQLQSMLVRDVVQIDYMTKLEPVLTFFKKGQSHMAVVTKVEVVQDKDPELKMIGIITLEDIIEELVDDQEDEDLKALQGEQLRHKEKLILLFSD